MCVCVYLAVSPVIFTRLSYTQGFNSYDTTTGNKIHHSQCVNYLYSLFLHMSSCQVCSKIHWLNFADIFIPWISMLVPLICNFLSAVFLLSCSAYFLNSCHGLQFLSFNFNVLSLYLKWQFLFCP